MIPSISQTIFAPFIRRSRVSAPTPTPPSCPSRNALSEQRDLLLQNANATNKTSDELALNAKGEEYYPELDASVETNMPKTAQFLHRMATDVLGAYTRDSIYRSLAATLAADIAARHDIYFATACDRTKCYVWRVFIGNNDAPYDTFHEQEKAVACMNRLMASHPHVRIERDVCPNFTTYADSTRETESKTTIRSVATGVAADTTEAAPVLKPADADTTPDWLKCGSDSIESRPDPTLRAYNAASDAADSTNADTADANDNMPLREAIDALEIPFTAPALNVAFAPLVCGGVLRLVYGSRHPSTGDALYVPRADVARLHGVSLCGYADYARQHRDEHAAAANASLVRDVTRSPISTELVADCALFPDIVPERKRQPAPLDPNVLVLKQVAEQLNTSLSWVQQLVHDGKLKSFKRNGRRLVLQRDLDEYCRERDECNNATCASALSVLSKQLPNRDYTDITVAFASYPSATDDDPDDFLPVSTLANTQPFDTDTFFKLILDGYYRLYHGPRHPETRDVIYLRRADLTDAAAHKSDLAAFHKANEDRFIKRSRRNRNLFGSIFKRRHLTVENLGLVCMRPELGKEIVSLMEMPPNADLVSVVEAARRVHAPKRTVYFAARAGIFNAVYTLNGRLFITRDSIAAYLAAHPNCDEHTLWHEITVKSKTPAPTPAPDTDDDGGKLFSITKACHYVGQNYSWVYRRIKDGVLDVVDVSGRRLVTKRSLDELVQGKRTPSADVLRRRAERNAARRAEYQRSKYETLTKERINA